MKWEYKVVTHGTLGQEELDELGQEHWELCACYSFENKVITIFKRQSFKNI